MKPFFKLLVASLKEFSRDRTTLGFTIILPILLVAFFGLAYGGISQRMTVGIVTASGSTTAVAPAIIRDLRGLPGLRVERGSNGIEMARLRDGTVQAVLTTGRGGADILFNRNDGTIGLAVQGLRTSLARSSISGRPGGMAVRASGIGGISANRLDYVIPGILATAIMWLGIFAAIPLVQQREQQVLRRLAVTPVSRFRLVSAQVLSRLLVSLLQAAFILAAARLVFGVPIGSRFSSPWVAVFGLAGLVVLGSLAFVAIGYAVAALSATQSGAHAWAQLLTMPMLVLAGVFFPLTLMPGVLVGLAAVLPLTYLADALRQTVLNGQHFASIPVDMAALAAWFVVPLAVAVRFFRWSSS